MFKREVKEVAPRIYRFSEPSGSRIINFYGIKEGDGWTLIDCGLPESVASWIKEEVILGEINRLFITHADADHFGSGAWLKANYPKLRIFCHPADRRHIEDHKLILKNRYDVARPEFGYGYPQKTMDALSALCGDNFEVDGLIDEGDVLSISGDEWKIMHLPGHSPGHIGLLRRKDNIFLIGDAFLADGPPDSRGNPSMPPTHENITDYLNSIERAKTIRTEKVFSGHWMTLDRNGFVKLLKKSEEVVFRDIKIITTYLREGEKSFKEILTALNKLVSTWPQSEFDHYLYAVYGYLKYLELQGKLIITKKKKVKLI